MTAPAQTVAAGRASGVPLDAGGDGRGEPAMTVIPKFTERKVLSVLGLHAGQASVSASKDERSFQVMVLDPAVDVSTLAGRDHRGVPIVLTSVRWEEKQ